MTMNFNYMAEPRSSGFRSRESGFTPAQDWARFKSEVQPFWSRRAPMGDIGGQLGAQYMLSAPSLAKTAQGDRPTFGQFITGTGGYPAESLSSIIVIGLVPILLVAAVYNRYFFRKTGNVYVGAFLNTILITLITLANTVLYTIL